MRVEFGREPEPGQDLALVSMLEMRVFCNQGVAADPFEQITRRTQEIGFVLLSVLVAVVVTGFLMIGAPATSKVILMVDGLLVEDGGIITAVEIDVRLGHEMIGQELAAVAEKD